MAAFYPPMLAGGITDLGRFDQFDLFAGESKIVTDQAQAPDGVAITQFQVLQMDANGRMKPWVATDLYAYTDLTFTEQPDAGDTVTINGHVITFRASGAVANEVNIGANFTETAQNLKTLINAAAPTFYAVHASGDGAVLRLTAFAAGTGGNTIATVTSSNGNEPVFTGATLVDVLATEESPTGNAVAIAAQPVAAATPGAYFPVFVGGIFNHEVLVWPGGVSTLAQRKAAFSGTMLGVRQLL